MLSAIRSIGDLWNGLHVAQERPLTASEQDHVDIAHAFVRQDNAAAFGEQFAGGGDDPNRQAIEQRAADRLQALTGWDGQG